MNSPLLFSLWDDKQNIPNVPPQMRGVYACEMGSGLYPRELGGSSWVKGVNLFPGLMIWLVICFCKRNIFPALRMAK